MEYYSVMKRNRIGSFVEMWKDLESIIQSEIRKRKTNKYCMCIESRKIVQVNLFAGQEKRHRCRKWMCGHGVG